METTHVTGSAIGVDLGGTKLLAGLFDAAGSLVQTTHTLVGHLDTDGIVDALADTVLALAQASSDGVVAAGYGVPATIDQRTGTTVVAPNLPLSGVPLRDMLRERTGLATYLDNDANVAALAEQRRGAGAGVTDDLLMVTLGTGFGGGIVSGGRIIRGAIGAGAELGHMSIDADGPPCIAPNCPNHGCLEAFVSGSALARDVREHVAAHPRSRLADAVGAGALPDGATALALARDGDQGSRELLEAMGRYLGVGLVNLVNIFNPGVICVGGGMSPTLDILLPIARELVASRALAPGGRYVSIVPAHFGSDAGMIGAAIMARAQFAVAGAA